MKAQAAFGRRSSPQPPPRPSRPSDSQGVTPRSIAPIEQDSRSEDEELRAWKAARGVRVPWRPFLLIASLSFGMAALVLPAATSDPIQWTLGVLSAAAFVAGLKDRILKRNAA